MLAVLVMAIFSTEVVLLGRLIMRQSINRQSRDWVSRSVCYWRLVNYSITPAFVRYWTNSGQQSIFASDGLSTLGPRLCENFNVRRARRSIFEKLRDMRTDNAADIRLNAMLGNCIFYISPMYEFSHSLDP